MGVIEFIENGFRLHGKKIKLYQYQKKFLKDSSSFRFVNKSRRIGMTQTIAWEALYRALNYPNTWVAIVSVSDRVAKDVMSYIYDAFYSHMEVMKNLDPHYVQTHLRVGVKTKSDLRFPATNSRIESLPNNPRSVRGKTITDLYLDEFAHYQDAESMYSAILPSITLDRGNVSSRVTFISTPLAKIGPFYKFWANKNKPEYKHITYHKIHWKDCSALKNKIELIRRSMDEDQFQREYCCQFIDELLSALPFTEIKACINHELQDTQDLQKTKNPVYVGIDYGKVRDSTVIVVLEISDEKYIIRHIKEFKPSKGNPNSYKEAAEYILRNYKRWNPNRIIVDLQGPGQGTIEDLKELGSLVKGESLSIQFKDKIFAHLKRLFLDRMIMIPNNESLVNQLHAIEKRTTDSGMIRYTHPTKGLIKHDDYVWALALACFEGQSGSSTDGGAVYMKGSTFHRGDDEDRLGSNGFTFKY